jgi:L-asparaginase
MTSSTLEYLLNTPGIKGVVLKTYGAGNSPSGEWFTGPIAKAIERGVVILNVTQCVNGAVNSSLYDTGNTLARAGVISGHDITSEAAITKMMYLFGKGMSNKQVEKYLQRNICGEMTINKS